jgi:malate dehydrogenase (oxaloacetate-decarboxylating)(NADP+)
MTDSISDAALEYHREPVPGKLEIRPTKPLENQSDLALAYSPGVAQAALAIAADPSTAALYTCRANLVAVITNGTAVLGLGPVGPLAAKPVMEGKAVLFKKFAGIDAIDIEIDERDPDKLVSIIAALEPSFGGINLEDIKAPECFEIEERLRARMGIPVFHDDQHGTAIIVSAAILNALKLLGKDIATAKLVASGAGAAALSCLDLLVLLGLPVANITVTDIAGVVYEGRTELMDARKARYAKPTAARTLAQAIEGADIFLGLSAGGVLEPQMVERMADPPIVMALANPEPEIRPEAVHAVRPRAIVATGRTDYPNQVNNVLCFPFIFRGALDVGARTVTEEMKLACVHALRSLAKVEASDVVVDAYGGSHLQFGPQYLIPKPFDPRLLSHLAPAVAKAAMDSGVATRPIANLEAYARQLDQFVWRSGLAMRPFFEAARAEPLRVAYAEGEEPRVLRAAQQAVDAQIARPVLVGDPAVISQRIRELGLRLEVGLNCTVSNPKDPELAAAQADLYLTLMGRRGVTPDIARKAVTREPSLHAALLLRQGAVQAALCGTVGRFEAHLEHVLAALGKAPGVTSPATVSAMVLRRGLLFFCDHSVSADPSPADVATTTLLACDVVRQFGRLPRVALLSSSSFGSRDVPSAHKMRQALALLRERSPELSIDGEMHADEALSDALRIAALPATTLRGEANLLVMPTLDAAQIGFDLVRTLADGLAIGPLLLGVDGTAHVLHPTVSVRGILNMTAIAVVQAQRRHRLGATPAPGGTAP